MSSFKLQMHQNPFPAETGFDTPLRGLGLCKMVTKIKLTATRAI